MWGKNRTKTQPFWNILEHSRPWPQPLPLQRSSESLKLVFYQHPPAPWPAEHRGLRKPRTEPRAAHFPFKRFY